MKGAKIQDLF